MGLTMVNYYVRSSNRFRMAEIMQEWCGEHRVTDGPAERQGRALISPAHQGWTVIYDESVERQAALLDALGVRLSSELGVDVIAVRIYNHEVLAYTVYDDTGRVVDEYISEPDQTFVLKGIGDPDDMDDIADDMEHPTDFARMFRSDVKLLEELASSPMADADMFRELLDHTKDGVALADELLEEFASLLGIDEKYIGLGYRDWNEFLDEDATKGFLHIT
jgi:PAS domain-containing protein